MLPLPATLRMHGFWDLFMVEQIYVIVQPSDIESWKGYFSRSLFPLRSFCGIADLMPQSVRLIFLRTLLDLQYVKTTWARLTLVLTRVYAVKLLSLIIYIHYQLVNMIACCLCNVLPFQVLLMITEKQAWIVSFILEQFPVVFVMDKTQHILKEPEIGRFLWSMKFLHQVGQVMYYSLVYSTLLKHL